MEILKEKLEKYKIPEKLKSKITSERQLVIQEFLDRLNLERGKYPSLKPARIGMLLRFMNTSQLKTFLAECKDANHFSKYFWYMTNPKNFQ